MRPGRLGDYNQASRQTYFALRFGSSDCVKKQSHTWEADWVITTRQTYFVLQVVENQSHNSTTGGRLGAYNQANNQTLRPYYDILKATFGPH